MNATVRGSSTGRQVIKYSRAHAFWQQGECPRMRGLAVLQVVAQEKKPFFLVQHAAWCPVTHSMVILMSHPTGQRFAGCRGAQGQGRRGCEVLWACPRAQPRSLPGGGLHYRQVCAATLAKCVWPAAKAWRAATVLLAPCITPTITAASATASHAGRTALTAVSCLLMTSPVAH